MNLHIPSTRPQRFRVMVTDLIYIENLPLMPKKSENPKIEVNAIRAGIEEFQHSILDNLQGEIAALKQFIRTKGVSADDELDKFSEATESNWTHAIEAIEDKLK